MTYMKSGLGIISSLPLKHLIRPSKINFRCTKFLNIKRKRFKDNFQSVNDVRKNFTTHIKKCILK